MNILPKKSWHVRNKDNVARVRKDEAQAAEEEREAKRRIERAEQEARTEYLRKKARSALEAAGVTRNEDEQESRPTTVSEHLNLFPLEESSEKKGNEEYLKEKKEETEKQERAIGLLVSLGPQPGEEITPWYMKTGSEKVEESKASDKKKTLTEEEKEKKQRRLKDSLDPLHDIKKALGSKDRSEHKSKKDKRDRGEKRSHGESSIERLRAERLLREAEERRKAQALIDQKKGKGKDSDAARYTNDRDRPYNNAYFPELARKRQRRDRDSWRDEILKS
uniref:Leukocyte receptor cluster (LRC) member 1 n=1 Tax=Neogobius melanostomus TaxID=47308 RepID=A0A8C6SXT4_9GOBI